MKLGIVSLKGTNVKIVHIDLDNTIMDYRKAHKLSLQYNPGQPYPQSQVGFFYNLVPFDYAMYSVIELMKKYDVYFLTAPSVKNPLCYTEKRLSIEKWFGLEACNKLIISPRKDLVIGDYLIDDQSDSHGQSDFVGEFIHYGSEKFPNWFSVLEYLMSKD